jgi:outer membrane biosynthesis protein TonB
MLRVPDHLRQSRREAVAEESAPAAPIRSALAGSVLLHSAIIALALFVLDQPVKAPSPIQIIAVNLVRFGEKTAASASESKAQVPQERAAETAPAEPAQAVPVPQPARPPSDERLDATRSSPAIVTGAAREPKPPKPIAQSRSEKRDAALLKRPQSPGDAMAARLQQLALLRQPPSPVPPSPQQQDGTGVSNATASAAQAGRTWSATYSIRDFIRAQVERRWNIDRSAIAGRDWAVGIHIRLDPNGRVVEAAIIGDPRYGADAAYRDFALSARNAVLLSSPLLVPPGTYDIAKDIVIDFDARQVSR